MITVKLKEITDDFSKKLQNLFDEKLFGVYLTGSSALGGYRFGKSGIDFTVRISIEAQNLRLGLKSGYHSPLRRRRNMIDYIEYMIDKCRKAI